MSRGHETQIQEDLDLIEALSIFIFTFWSCYIIFTISQIIEKFGLFLFLIVTCPEISFSFFSSIVTAIFGSFWINVFNKLFLEKLCKFYKSFWKVELNSMKTNFKRQHLKRLSDLTWVYCSKSFHLYFYAKNQGGATLWAPKTGWDEFRCCNWYWLFLSHFHRDDILTILNSMQNESNLRRTWCESKRHWCSITDLQIVLMTQLLLDQKLSK